VGSIRTRVVEVCHVLMGWVVTVGGSMVVLLKFSTACLNIIEETFTIKKDKAVRIKK
jgi:hypothetical protein